MFSFMTTIIFVYQFSLYPWAVYITNILSALTSMCSEMNKRINVSPIMIGCRQGPTAMTGVNVFSLSPSLHSIEWLRLRRFFLSIFYRGTKQWRRFFRRRTRARAVGMSVGGMARALEMTPRFDEGDRVTSLPRRSLPSVMTVVGIISWTGQSCLQ